ncbi:MULTISPECIES: protein kinase domain-containing protein [unclassified Streptomyces]|uniref:protein kinase domain-containing protein n=1 Tax=unclassified Streptomyces TaxID=2593676 RepID=UPI002DDB5E26|nr:MULTISPECIES: protein kinase [unclassified Streptomyces]WSF81778.1 protein kinase [Streptomyces sp. NBC_01744]WSC34145.1 protein kinase [Streptomyces sp. NBC_01763]WSC41913.1 protein kinase [Streptomyces sp. NBC_01763]WSC50943.1 protein kinase [Streptomyces sp. NBC_01761]WSC58578.1 protein kinase [Streptomyces sp. NBC_01761]
MSSRIQPVQPGDPRRIGPYRVIGRLGTGGMGTVYAAVDSAGLQMAVKVVHPAQAADAEFRARFRREVQLSRRVTGPCLVPVHDADTDSNLPWLATPFVPGPTLDRYLATSGALIGARLFALAAGTAAALAAVHEAGIVHRDVKPQNVILAPSGPRVLDFGIAHALDGTSVTRTGVMTGTPGWISPEHYRTGAVGPEGDVFAWGALIAYAATGRLPFGIGAPDAVAFRIMSIEPDLEGVPDDLLQLVEQALSKEPGDRPTAAELGRTCTALLAAQATAVTSPIGEQPTLASDLVSVHWDLPHEDDPAWHAAPPRSRLRLYLAVAAAALVVGSIGGAIAAASTSGHEQGAAPSHHPKAAPASTTAVVEPTRSREPSSASPTPSKAAPQTEPGHQTAPSPAYTRNDATQPSIDEWADARVPATPAEKATAERLRSNAAQVLQGKEYMGDEVIVTFNPEAQTMFVTFGPGIFPEGQDYRDDLDWTDNVRSVMFGSCTEAQQNFHDDITWPYGRAAVVYRESMASPIIADFRDVTHSDSCRV